VTRVRRRTSLLVVGALALGSGTAALAPSAATGASAAPATILRPASVPGIMARYVSVNNRANATLSSPLLASIETGAAFTMDDASYTVDRAAGNPTLDGKTYYPFYAHVLSRSVPTEHHYPLRFAVASREIPSASDPARVRPCATNSGIFDFVKSSAAAPWRIDLEPYLPVAAAMPDFAVSPSGYGQIVAASKLATSPARLAAEIVAGLVRDSASGDPAPMPTGDFTSGICRLSLLNPHELVAYGPAHALTITFAAVPFKTANDVAYALRGGSSLVLLNVEESETARSVRSNGYVTWAQSPSQPDTYFLPAGRYPAVTESYLQELAVVEPPTGSTFKVVGSYWAMIGAAS